jgi:hypothetical protein
MFKEAFDCWLGAIKEFGIANGWQVTTSIAFSKDEPIELFVR